MVDQILNSAILYCDCWIVTLSRTKYPVDATTDGIGPLGGGPALPPVDNITQNNEETRRHNYFL